MLVTNYYPWIVTKAQEVVYSLLLLEGLRGERIYVGGDFDCVELYQTFDPGTQIDIGAVDTDVQRIAGDWVRWMQSFADLRGRRRRFSFESFEVVGAEGKPAVMVRLHVGLLEVIHYLEEAEASGLVDREPSPDGRICVVMIGGVGIVPFGGVLVREGPGKLRLLRRDYPGSGRLKGVLSNESRGILERFGEVEAWRAVGARADLLALQPIDRVERELIYG